MKTPSIAVTVALLVLVASSARAQTGVEHARALYLSADYEGALAALESAVPPEDAAAALDADRLRAFCLLALDRANAADAVIARIVTAHPAYDPGHEISPRLQLAFRAVRDRVVPALARRLYDEGRIAFDRGAWAEAVDRFASALPAIEALAMEGRRDMEDLRVLTNGFLALGRERIPRPAPQPLTTQAWPLVALPAPQVPVGYGEPVAR